MTDRSDDLVDKVAKALYASNLNQLGTSASYQPKYWRGQAQAAIDAMQLTPEYGDRLPGGVVKQGSDKAVKPVRRLVSPWVKVDADD